MNVVSNRPYVLIGDDDFRVRVERLALKQDPEVGDVRQRSVFDGHEGLFVGAILEPCFHGQACHAQP